MMDDFAESIHTFLQEYIIFTGPQWSYNFFILNLRLFLNYSWVIQVVKTLEDQREEIRSLLTCYFITETKREQGDKYLMNVESVF